MRPSMAQIALALELAGRHSVAEVDAALRSVGVHDDGVPMDAALAALDRERLSVVIARLRRAPALGDDDAAPWSTRARHERRHR